MIPFTMEPVTHALTGLAIKQLDFKQKAALAALLAGSLASEMRKAKVMSSGFQFNL